MKKLNVGSVVVNNLSEKESVEFKFKRPIKAVTFEPQYSKRQGKKFASGGLDECIGITGKGSTYQHA